MARKQVILKEVELSRDGVYEFGGPIDQVIEQLEALRDEAKERGIVDVYISCDYENENEYEYGGYTGNIIERWHVKVTGKQT